MKIVAPSLKDRVVANIKFRVALAKADSKIRIPAKGQ